MNKIFFIFCVIFSSALFAKETTLTFPDHCQAGKTLTIAAVGDILLHQPLQDKAQKNGFESLWGEAIPYLKSADIAYANLEGPMAQGVTEEGAVINERGHRLGRRIYTGFPAFNYHPSLAAAIRSSGFTIVSTANNHALDRFSIGIDKTIAALKQEGVAYAGTRPRNSDNAWVKIIHKKDFTIAWISCTETTNDNVDQHKQILYCYRQSHKEWILKTITELKPKVDAIIILPHWGEEYHHYPNEEQTSFAHQVLNAGATAVIGSHPHVLQPLEKYITKDGRATVIMYSLGNFVSNQSSVDQRSTVMLLLGLTKTDNATLINGVRFVPMYMQNHTGQESLHLTVLPKGSDLIQQIIGRVMPMGNALYGLPIVTNPECAMK